MDTKSEDRKLAKELENKEQLLKQQIQLKTTTNQKETLRQRGSSVGHWLKLINQMETQYYKINKIIVNYF